MQYHAICPECKNDINLDKESMQEGDHLECPTCGITLEVIKLDGNEIKKLEIVEMEK